MKDVGIVRGGIAVALPAGLVLLAGCLTVGPNYERPPAPTPAGWNASLTSGLSMSAANPQALCCWWTAFNDPLLSNLIERARTGNMDLRQAEARVREARAQRGFAKADLYPAVSAGASAARTRSSDRISALPGAAEDLFSTDFDASWELDLFGKKRRSLEAATAAWQAQQEDLNDVLVSLFAEVGLNYVDVRSYQSRLSITETNLATQIETSEITRWRYEAGLTTELDVDQARLSLEQARSDIPTLRTALEQSKQRLAVLLGQTPGALDDLLAEPGPIPVTPLDVAVGVPAEALRRRPDVRRAERRLAAQTAQIGVATADLYPSFSLAGTLGLQSRALGTLYTTGARTAQAAANGTLMLFDAGRIRRSIDVQTARQEQALSFYEATVLEALQNVEGALVAYANGHARRHSLAAAVEAAQSAFALARAQYSAGLISFDTLLDAQRSLLLTQNQMASADADVAAGSIRLYKSLGGGWTPPAQDAGEKGAKKSEIPHGPRKP